MPYFSIETNRQIDDVTNENLMKKATKFLSEMMGKPEHVIMVTIRPGMPYVFGGLGDPAAYVRIKAVSLERGKCPEFSKKVCDFLENEIGVPRDRVFIEFVDIDPKIFGFNGNTLAQ